MKRIIHLTMTLGIIASRGFGQITADPLPLNAPYILDLTPLEPHDKYLYSPSAIMDGNRKIFSCSGTHLGLNGDHIMRSEATATPRIEGTSMSAPETVFGPRSWLAWYGENYKAYRTFDQDGVCDPNAIRHGSYLYVFHTGLDNRKTVQLRTSIGLIRSLDGRTWESWHPAGWRNEQNRAGGGQAILKSIEPTDGVERYGTGHPSVVWLKPHFYLFYSDSEALVYAPDGVPARHPNGAGIFVIRSPDITFQNNVEFLTPSGFMPLYGDINSPSNYRARTSYPLQFMYGGRQQMLEVSVPEVQFSDMLNAFILINPTWVRDQNQNAVSTGVQLIPYPDLTRPSSSYLQVDLGYGSFFIDSLGSVRRPDGHSLPSTVCGHVPLEILGSWLNFERFNVSQSWADIPSNRATYAGRLAGSSSALRSNAPCNSSIWPSVFEGSILEQAGFPRAVALNGIRMDVQRWQVADFLSRNVIRNFTPEQFFSFPSRVTVQERALSVQPPRQPAGMKLSDDRIWITNCSGIIQANGSRWPPDPVPNYPRPIGGTLYCLF